MMTLHHIETSEHAMVTSVRAPNAPAPPPNVLPVSQGILPLQAARQAQSTTHAARLEASEARVSLARLVQQVGLTSPSGQSESSAAEMVAKQQALEAQVVVRAVTLQVEEPFLK